MLNFVFALALVVLMFVLVLLTLRHWNIHGKDYQRKAHIRKMLYSNPITKRFVTYKKYSITMQAMGWSACIWLWGFGALAFVSCDEKGVEGNPVFNW